MYNFTTCFKDARFLTFFFRNLKLNNTERYEKDFPYMSVCGNELNFVACDDKPIVYTNWDEENDTLQINWSRRTQKINPSDLFMLENGRLYHKCTFDSYGLMRSALADKFFPMFKFDKNGDPTHITYKNKLIELTNDKNLLKK
uniref:Uncharacterized protein n=1 Tax=Parastrongyloides trichosuri TaxID=131310 RepID=A0A0N4ZKP4_PARTI